MIIISINDGISPLQQALKGLGCRPYKQRPEAMTTHERIIDYATMPEQEYIYLAYEQDKGARKFTAGHHPQTLFINNDNPSVSTIKTSIPPTFHRPDILYINLAHRQAINTKAPHQLEAITDAEADQMIDLIKELQPRFYILERSRNITRLQRHNITLKLYTMPVLIDACKVTGMHKQRWYWSNIPGLDSIPNQRRSLQEYITSGWTHQTIAKCIDPYKKQRSYRRILLKGEMTPIFTSNQAHTPSLQEITQAAINMPKTDRYQAPYPYRFISDDEWEKLHGYPPQFTQALTKRHYHLAMSASVDLLRILLCKTILKNKNIDRKK